MATCDTRDTGERHASTDERDSARDSAREDVSEGRDDGQRSERRTGCATEHAMDRGTRDRGEREGQSEYRPQATRVKGYDKSH